MEEVLNESTYCLTFPTMQEKIIRLSVQDLTINYTFKDWEEPVGGVVLVSWFFAYLAGFFNCFRQELLYIAL